MSTKYTCARLIKEARVGCHRPPMSPKGSDEAKWK